MRSPVAHPLRGGQPGPKISEQARGSGQEGTPVGDTHERFAPPTVTVASSTSGRRVATNRLRKTTPGNVEGNFRKWPVGKRLE